MAVRATVLVVVALLQWCPLLAFAATTWTVGGSEGWTTGVNYSTWASGKNFSVGDVLFFPYASGAHDVAEVDKSGYDACSATTSIAVHSSGNTNITLNATGTRYFMCSFPGHCASGMELAVTVQRSASSTPAASPSPVAVPKSSPATAPRSARGPTPAPSPLQKLAPTATTPPPQQASSPAATSVPTSPAPTNLGPPRHHLPAAASLLLLVVSASLFTL